MISTNYVWTSKGQQQALDNGHSTRLAGTPASFAYQPLEKSPETAKAWIRAGYVKKTQKAQPFIFFNSETDDEDLRYIDAITFLHENNIPWKFIDFMAGKFIAAISADDTRLVQASFHKVCGNLYLLTEKDSPLDLLCEAAKKEEVCLQ